MTDKEYLGDSVYVQFDGYAIWLTTENGGPPYNQIALEPPILIQLNEYYERLKQKYTEQPNP